MKPELANYRGREQSYFKHRFLEKYLTRGGIIIGSWADSFTYVEGFSGPWRSQSETLGDTSFAIALNQLREAQRTVQERFGKDLKLRAFFIESDRVAHGKLRAYADERAGIEIETRHSTFEESISEAVAFARSGARSNFTFTCIDPTGWKGFALSRITPLLSLERSECLINLQTSFIRRFITLKESRASFEELFGSSEPMDAVGALALDKREEFILREYAQRIRLAGGFSHVSAAVVLRPNLERPQFHLIYLTRNRKGVSVFKDAEKAIVEEMPEIRGRAKQRKREEQSGQLELTSMAESRSSYLDRIGGQYRIDAWTRIKDKLRLGGQLLYDDAFDIAMTHPLVWEQDLKEWIRQDGTLQIAGLKPGERVPKLNMGHFLQAK